ncbi:hypothetical protein BMETH_356_0 [methanotrophic bacterial endosymbiont of Bathymodiolus sp.]|nr:hypothetical protein BMETH_356_0 [methanotrophic bacterial endosymbiont of Bathymodiolus sp.]
MSSAALRGSSPAAGSDMSNFRSAKDLLSSKTGPPGKCPRVALMRLSAVLLPDRLYEETTWVPSQSASENSHPAMESGSW